MTSNQNFYSSTRFLWGISKVQILILKIARLIKEIIRQHRITELNRQKIASKRHRMWLFITTNWPVRYVVLFLRQQESSRWRLIVCLEILFMLRKRRVFLWVGSVHVECLFVVVFCFFIDAKPIFLIAEWTFPLSETVELVFGGYTVIILGEHWKRTLDIS